MKSAVVVGGSNGIGLAISKELIQRGKHVYIIDCVKPKLDIGENYTYIYCNLMQMNLELVKEMASKDDIDFLMITAGIGRITEFENLDDIEIKKVLTINAVSEIEIIHCFYDRIKSNENFYCGIMGSIAGLIVSPMFSVYAASKAAICRFV